MPDTRTAEEKIEHIRQALHDCQAGKMSITSFAILVGMTVDPLPLTEADFEWARNKWAEIQQSGLTMRAADVLVRCVHCDALIETDVHCDNCGSFHPTRR